MRIPDVAPPVVIPVAEELPGVEPGAAIAASRRVAVNPAATLLLPAVSERTEEEKARAQEAYERTGEDRRKMCRRIYKMEPLLDTRSGKDRRKETRREEDPLTHISKKV